MANRLGRGDSGLGQDQGSRQDMGGLARLPGLDEVREQLTGVIAVIQAEVARREAGIAVVRPTWKNLVFAGGPGSGKSRGATAVGRIYRELGVLSSGHLVEASSADLVGATSEGTGRLVREMTGRADGGVLMINHAQIGPRAYEEQLARSLLEELTYLREQVTVILAGQADQVRSILDSSPALASRFPAIIRFPRYSGKQLVAIFATLAGEAGFTLTSPAARKGAAVLARADAPRSGNARLAVRLLHQATARQAHRITTARKPIPSTALCAIRATDIPDDLDLPTSTTSADGGWPGQYL